MGIEGRKERIPRLDRVESARGHLVSYGREAYVVVDKLRANLVRPRQYPLSAKRFAGSYMFKLQKVKTQEMCKLVMHEDGTAEWVEFDMKNPLGRRKERKKT